MKPQKKEDPAFSVPFIDLALQNYEIEQELLVCIRNVITGGKYILGENVSAFENEVAEFLGVNHAIGVASGTDALHLALIALDIDHGDEVITSPFSFIATVEAVQRTGAKPVFADIDARTFNLSTESVAEAITSKTAAVLPVHLFGHTADITGLSELCKLHGLWLVEDCCQSFGAEFSGKKTGTFGDAAGFSFYPSKILGALGDAGLVVTNDESTARKIRSLRNHGTDSENLHSLPGYNSRMDEIHAAVLRIKLGKVPRYIDRRREIARLYCKLLSDLPVELPYEVPGAVHVFNQFTILTEDRDYLAAELRASKIATAVYYPLPLYRQPLLSRNYPGLHLPVTEKIAKHCISLPVYPELEDECILKIVNVIENALKNKKSSYRKPAT